MDARTAVVRRPHRQALIGGACALAVGAVLFPADPALDAGRAGLAVFAALGRAVQRVAAGPERSDADETRAALDDARAIDPLLAEARELLEARERLVPRSARRQLERYERSLGQVRSARPRSTSSARPSWSPDLTIRSSGPPRSCWSPPAERARCGAARVYGGWVGK